MYDLIIENANLVTCDKNHNVFENASMAITDGKIQAIESNVAKSFKELSASQKINIDKRVAKKQAFIKKLAQRLLPRVKQAELVRLRIVRSKK